MLNFRALSGSERGSGNAPNLSARIRTSRNPERLEPPSRREGIYPKTNDIVAIAGRMTAAFSAHAGQMGRFFAHLPKKSQ